MQYLFCSENHMELFIMTSSVDKSVTKTSFPVGTVWEWGSDMALFLGHLSTRELK